MPKLRYGHAPGHIRETAGEAFEAWMAWDGQGPEPTVDFEINYTPHRIPISRACGMVWNCTDIVPGSLFDQVQATVEDIYGERKIKHRTYAACARAIVENIKETRAAA